eukprot:UN23055
MFGHCPHGLSKICCASCGAKIAEDTEVLADQNKSCTLASQTAFSKYGACSPDLVEECGHSCALQLLTSTGPATKEIIISKTDYNSGKADRTMCENLPTLNGDTCGDVATKAIEIWGECPSLLDIVCCAACEGQPSGCGADECCDDVDWNDEMYGDGTSTCSDMTWSWCNEYGDYS